MRGRAHAFIAFLCAFGAISLGTTRANAQALPKSPASLPLRTATFQVEGSVVFMSVAFRDIVDDEIRKKLMSGLPTVVVMRAYLFREAEGAPIALAAKSCHVVYDLWDEIFRIELAQAGSSTQTVAINIEGVLRQCAEARHMQLGAKDSMTPNGRYFVAGLVEVNPISTEMLDRIKRWVTRPSGSAPLKPTDSLFGSFIGLFVTRVENADRRLSFRTQTLIGPSR